MPQLLLLLLPPAFQHLRVVLLHRSLYDDWRYDLIAAQAMLLLVRCSAVTHHRFSQDRGLTCHFI